MLYAADADFWRAYAEAHALPGLKVSSDPRSALAWPQIQPVHLAPGPNGGPAMLPVRGPLGTIAGGGNSGFQAVNLAAQLGATRILLIGFDMAGPHWHGDHARGLRNPADATLDRWRRTLDAAAPVYRGWGVDVVNLSASSTLSAYRRSSLEDALA